jgi:hypothetical protein
MKMLTMPRLSQDATFRLIGSRTTWERGTGAALTSRLQSFETEVLTLQTGCAYQQAAGATDYLCTRADALGAGLKLSDIKCGWFNERRHNEFFPRLLLPRSSAAPVFCCPAL